MRRAELGGLNFGIQGRGGLCLRRRRLQQGVEQRSGEKPRKFHGRTRRDCEEKAGRETDGCPALAP
ncbi:hypothetical protein A176_004368 [Myxococcus hansupus]|uniref:Uncharacterized protein n=1 Tax=Pseudomyxococcus hansupus TaxID=1297742 RepID=A0A0H4WVN2_9BACT|nr:hypothetical protein A176_004368 [Myxococcus hansupus]